MEVPVINRVGDLQVVIGRFPVMISRVLIEQVPEILSFWKWGAVIIAVYAIVNSLLVSFKIEFVRFRNRQSAVTKAILSYTTDEDYSSDEEDDDDDDSVSSSSVNEDEYSEDDDEDVEKVKVRNDSVFSSLFDFRVAGSRKFEKCNNEMEDEDVNCRFSWSNFANGKNVVKLWDGMGLGLDLNSASASIVSIHNLNNPSVILTAGNDVDTSQSFLSLIDTRVGKQPVIIKNWSSANETVEKMRVVDLRKATEEMTMEDAAEWSNVTWWDADGGGVDDDDDGAIL